jgi:hypothetical protein
MKIANWTYCNTILVYEQQYVTTRQSWINWWDVKSTWVHFDEIVWC